MGVHTGEAAHTSAGLLGLDVHRAARVAAVASGGQILLSETTAALVRDSLPAGAALRDLGLHRLKDLGRPEQIFQLDAAGLPAEFPPLRSLDNPALPNNLPVQLTAFIGREREMAEVRALLGSSRLVTLTGAGGAGKTRLSLSVPSSLIVPTARATCSTSTTPSTWYWAGFQADPPVPGSAGRDWLRVWLRLQTRK